MRFKRYVGKKGKVITSRKRAAAERAVKKDKDNYALFPELVMFQSAEERLRYYSEQNKMIWAERRERRVHEWRQARWIIYHELTEHQRRGVLLFWNELCNYPGDPSHLLSILREVVNGKTIYGRLVYLRKAKLVGERRLPYGVMRGLPIPSDWQPIIKEE